MASRTLEVEDSNLTAPLMSPIANLVATWAAMEGFSLFPPPPVDASIVSIVGGYQMSKREDISLQHIPAVGHTQEESFETKKLKIHPSSNLLGRILWYLGVWDICKSLGSQILVLN